jgi:hypothetical protein
LPEIKNSFEKQLWENMIEVDEPKREKLNHKLLNETSFDRFINFRIGK